MPPGLPGYPAPPARRPLTEIELRLVSRITDLFCKEMKHAWENVLDLDLSIDRVESNPQLVQIVPPNEVVVLISFELTLGEARGMMNLCIPFNSIERIATRLSSNSWVSYSKRPPSLQSMQHISDQIAEAPVEVVVELATTRITTADMLGLRVGDIIASEKDVRDSLLVYVQGVPKFLASPGKYKGRKPKARMQAPEVKRLKLEGIGPTAIAKRLGISRASVYRVLA